MQREKWSAREKKIARAAFDQAYARECESIIAEVRKSASAIRSPEDLWSLESYLRRKRKAIDDKYDYRYSVLLFVFARLAREGWLSLDDLQGLADDKLQTIELMLSYE